MDIPDQGFQGKKPYEGIYTYIFGEFKGTVRRVIFNTCHVLAYSGCDRNDAAFEPALCVCLCQGTFCSQRLWLYEDGTAGTGYSGSWTYD